MNINKQAFEIRGVTVEDYLKYCEKKKWQAYKPSSKKAFFERLDTGRLVKDAKTGELLEKKPRKKK